MVFVDCAYIYKASDSTTSDKRTATDTRPARVAAARSKVQSCSPQKAGKRSRRRLLLHVYSYCAE